MINVKSHASDRQKLDRMQECEKASSTTLRAGLALFALNLRSARVPADNVMHRSSVPTVSFFKRTALRRAGDSFCAAPLFLLSEGLFNVGLEID